MIGGSEYIRIEREQQRQPFPNERADKTKEPEILNRISAEANIKSAMQLYVKCSAVVVLDSWNDNTRYQIP